jgi:hypothetical protein
VKLPHVLMERPVQMRQGLCHMLFDCAYGDA